MASRWNFGARSTPETVSQSFDMQSELAQSGLDVVGEAQQLLKQQERSIAPRELLEKLRVTRPKPEGWEMKPETIAARTLLGVLRVATHEALRDRAAHTTIEYDAHISFEKIAENGNKYVVLGLRGDKQLTLPTDYTVQVYEDFQAESVRTIAPEDLEPSLTCSVSIGKNNFARHNQTPYTPNSQTHMHNMTAIAADLLG